MRGDEVPEDLKDRSTRRARLAAAKKLLEDKAAAEQAAHEAHLAERAAKEESAGKKLRGRTPTTPAEKAKKAGKAPRANTTDPNSRLLSTRNGFLQGHNAQAAANEDQIILAAEVTQDAGDIAQLAPMLTAIEREAAAVGIGDPVGVLLADAGYACEAVLAVIADRGPDFYIATRNMRYGKPRAGSRGPLPANATAMDSKVSTAQSPAPVSARPSSEPHPFTRQPFEGDENVNVPARVRAPSWSSSRILQTRSPAQV